LALRVYVDLDQSIFGRCAASLPERWLSSFSLGHWHVTMDLRITCDADQKSGVGEVVGDLSGPTRKHFASRDYGSGLPGLGVVLICRDPGLNLKRRIRLSKRDRTLYMDVMLQLPDMTALAHDERCRIIMQKLEQEISQTLTKYEFAEFDQARFESDLRAWFVSLGGLSDR
jgi:hypothetical protein